MNYYRRWVGDYLRDTAHLSLLEHGAYGVLLDHYYASELPLPKARDAIYRITRAISVEERSAVDSVLNQFFAERDDGWHNKRADEEIAKFNDATSNMSEAGRRGAEARWGKDREPHREPHKRGNGVANGGGNGVTQGVMDGKQHGVPMHPPTSNLQPPVTTTPTTKEKPTAARAATSYPDEFESIWGLYPKRDGDNPKRRAFRAFTARLKEGHTHGDIKSGVERYAAWVRARGHEHTEIVKQAATFFGPDKPFLDAWQTESESHPRNPLL